MDTAITQDPVIPADACGYQTWMVATPRGEVASCHRTDAEAIHYWRNSGAYSARPARVSDFPALRAATAGATASWGRLD